MMLAYQLVHTFPPVGLHIALDHKTPAWTYGGREVSVRPAGLVGQWLLPGDEAYDAQLIAVMKVIHHLASRCEQRRGFTIFMDSGSNEEAAALLTRTRPGRGKRDNRAGPYTTGARRHRRHSMGPRPQGVEGNELVEHYARTAAEAGVPDQEDREQLLGPAWPSSSPKPPNGRHYDGGRTLREEMPAAERSDYPRRQPDQEPDPSSV